jgi:hypothetical protein
MLAVMLGVTALAFDGGLLLAARQDAQATADSTALAAAATLLAGGSPQEARLAGIDVAGANCSGCRVDLDIPPTGGNEFFQGKRGYAKATVTIRVRATLAGIFVPGPYAVSASATARGLWNEDGTRSYSLVE